MFTTIGAALGRRLRRVDFDADQKSRAQDTTAKAGALFDDRESVSQFVAVMIITVATLALQYRGHLFNDYVVTAFEQGDYFFQKHCEYITVRPTRDVRFGGRQSSLVAAQRLTCPFWPPVVAKASNAVTAQAQ